MDDIVRQAMAKWPDVPAVYGWLWLDLRGNWLIKGERISNRVITDFISRNYEHDGEGRWYFQNGPQRVFVTLAYAPYVYRLSRAPECNAPLRMLSHTGRTVTRVDSIRIDENGIVILVTEFGPGIVDDRDLDYLLPCFTDRLGVALVEDDIAEKIERLQSGNPPPLYFRYENCIQMVSPITEQDVSPTFGFIKQPAQPPGEEFCI